VLSQSLGTDEKFSLQKSFCAPMSVAEPDRGGVKAALNSFGYS